MPTKVLIIHPSHGYEQGFSLLDPDTGEVLATHFCSNHRFAKHDLHDRRDERLAEWETRYGMKTEAKKIEQTDYVWEEVYKKNQALKPKK